MKKSTLVVSAFMLLAFAIWGSLAYADVVVTDIQFPFKAGGKEFSAGKYRIETILQSEELTIRNEATGKAVVLSYTTRLSPRESEEGSVVFDKAGDQYYLSEIYMPGIDGFGLKGATGKHTHVKVKGSK